MKKLDKALQEAGKALDETHTLCGEIQKDLGCIRRGLSRVREKLAVYMERRRLRYAQFLNDKDWDLLFLIVLCAVGVMLFEKYMPAWLRLVVWAALLGGAIYCVGRRFFRRAY